MAEVSYENPEPNEALPSSDAKIRTALVKLKETVNGKLGSANLEAAAGITDTQLASPNNSVYRTLLSATSVTGEESNGTYIIGSKSGVTNKMISLSGSINTKEASSAWIIPPILGFKAANYEVASRTTKLRVFAELLTNETAPGVTFKIFMWSLVGGGGENVLKLGSGSKVEGSEAKFTTPAATSSLRAESADFSAPSEANYVLVIETSGALAAKSVIGVSAHVGIRNV